jgi:hypothetical protein
MHLRAKEEAAGLTQLHCYCSLAAKVKETKRRFLDFLMTAKRQGQSLAGYGAPGKGDTLLNYRGVRTAFLDYVVDRSPYTRGKFLPGTRLPIRHPDTIRQAEPDYVLILPWNLRDEVMHQLSYIREWETLRGADP